MSLGTQTSADPSAARSSYCHLMFINTRLTIICFLIWIKYIRTFGVILCNYAKQHFIIHSAHKVLMKGVSDKEQCFHPYSITRTALSYASINIGITYKIHNVLLGIINSCRRLKLSLFQSCDSDHESDGTTKTSFTCFDFPYLLYLGY